MADNLLPCPNPWCDSGVQPMSFAMRGGFHQVICGCDFKGPRKATKDEAEAAWNRRPAPTEADTSLQKVQTTPLAMEAVAWRENLADFARYVSGQMHNLPRSATADNVNDRALAILQALAVIPTEWGGGRETKGPGT